MRVYVNQNDIKNGVVANNNSCPIALALKRKTGKNWSVGPSEAHCRKARYELSQKAIDFVWDFDCNGKVLPFHAYLKRIK